MDACKIAPSLYQYTLIDDCTRYRALSLYKLRTASKTLDFFETIIVEVPFSLQRLQIASGSEFLHKKV